MKKIKWPVYKDCDDPQWEVGMTFKDHHECREAITKHSYKEGRMVRFLLRAKRKAMKIIHGSDAEQYSKLWDYRTELIARNPNSTIELEFEEGMTVFLV
ncbi:hypothetical protein DCAR_0520398 [Daucus carota subsp. sativus]|uniref:Uncharacterized protein n=1 Tax=Daucus carota subsp. sativus TaxID=79200 RepID=A0AAF0X405_DAUCS|nr:hypothetical protein DCAR_0520398 [Daucus carota subsp. sativus]